MVSVRVLLVDEYPVYRDGLKVALDSEPSLTVCGEAGSAEEAAHHFDCLSPDMVLMGLALDDDRPHQLLQGWLQQRPELLAIVISPQGSHREVIRAIECGARGFLTKSATQQEVVSAVQQVLNGNSYLHPQVAQVVFDQVRQPFGKDEYVLLTPRERDILDLLCQGLSPHEVAGRLFVSLSTVKTHMRGLYRKFQVSTRAQLILKCVGMGRAQGTEGENPVR